ncbi:hypothetical protein DBV15_11326, partial [Temnothorax longispinosus]
MIIHIPLCPITITSLTVTLTFSPSANNSFTFSQFDSLPPHFSFSTLKITFLFLSSSSFLSPSPAYHFFFSVPLSSYSSLFLLPPLCSILSTFLSKLLTFSSSSSILSPFFLSSSFLSLSIFLTFSSTILSTASAIILFRTPLFLSALSRLSLSPLHLP